MVTGLLQTEGAVRPNMAVWVVVHKENLEGCT
ncbi:hypothetical protein Halar_1373 [halophilic archaeon DL31]|jgi:hypothetical protein|nr:hypothetical protein Halar_1373 [halophilic archaeon DL31]